MSDCDLMACSTPGSSVFHYLLSLLKFMSPESLILSNHLVLCHPILLLPSLFSTIRVFSSESALCIRWQKYWSLSFSISPSSEYSGFISLRIDWFDPLAVQGSLKSLLQHLNLKASLLWSSGFFMVQLSRPYMTTGKTEPLTRQTFVSKVMSLFFNTLCLYSFPSKEQASFNFMAAVTIHSDFGAQSGGGGNLSLLPFFPFAFAMKCWDQIHTLVIQSLLDILSLNLG